MLHYIREKNWHEVKSQLPQQPSNLDREAKPVGWGSRLPGFPLQLRHLLAEHFRGRAIWEVNPVSLFSSPKPALASQSYVLRLC